MAIGTRFHGSRSRALLTSITTSVIAVLAALLYTVGPAAISAHAASFPVFNQTQTNWPNWGLEQFGLTDSTWVIDVWGLSCSSTGCSNVPSQSAYEAQVQSDVSNDKSGSTGPIALDFESIVPVDASSTAQAAQEVSLFKQLITWTHDAEPNAPVGEYSYDWNNAYSSYTAQLYASGYLDYFAPTMYNRWATVSDWQTELNDAVANDRAISSSLPIYPYIWAQWDNSSSPAFLSAGDWDTEFQDLKSQTQGAIMWAGNAQPMDSTACGWLDEFAYEMGVLTGTSSSGPLTVTDTPPSTCEAARGATTDIPVKITNNGSSTSAATVLQTESGPQGITESYQYYDVPALAPGASWTTTLEVTVPSSEADQTALLHIDYGTGSQRLTLIIA